MSHASCTGAGLAVPWSVPRGVAPVAWRRTAQGRATTVGIPREEGLPSVRIDHEHPPEHRADASVPAPRDGCPDADIGRLVEILRPDLLRRVQALRDSLGGLGLSATDLTHASVARFLAAARRDGSAALTRGEAWGLLTTIAHHLFIDSIRRKSARRTALERFRRDRAGDIAVDGAEPARCAERRDLAERALSAMTEEERLLVARRMQGVSWAAIASEVGVGEEALRKRWSALRRRLRTLADSDE